jgi:hypothetical protein
VKKFLFIGLMISQTVFGQITIHVLHPWAANPVLGKKPLHLQCYESWYPGVVMISECDNWYTYTLTGVTRTSNDHFNFAIDTGNSGNNYINYPAAGAQQLIYSDIFSTAPANVNEVWITATSPTAAPVLKFVPPLHKNIYILNPWDFGAPMVQLQSGGIFRMYMDTSSSRCGWFSYPYYCNYDSARVKFMNSMDSSYFSALGLGDGAFIDLSATFKTSDTAWILASGAGPAVVYAKFPGQTAPCEREVYLAVTLRNYPENHPDFGGFSPDGKNAAKDGKCWRTGDWWGIITGIMSPQLVAGKPVPSPTNPCPIDRFDWFTTLPLQGYTNAMCYNLKLVKNSDGYFEYDSPYFFPADSFRWLDPGHSVANPWYSQIPGDDGS